MSHGKVGWLYIIGLTFLKTIIAEYEPNIIIVGAGPSGIAAASKLFESGFRNVTILEAESRIGGRVYTKRFDNKWIDLGGQWVHGQVGNLAYELASPFGLLEVPTTADSEVLIYYSDGYRLPSSITNDLFETYLEAIDTDLTGKNGTVGQYVTEILNNSFDNFPTVNQTLRNSFLELFEGFTKASDASETWYGTSAQDYVYYEECPGHNSVNWKDKGYGVILDILTKKYPNPEEELPVLNNTQLNTEVGNIDYNTTSGKVLIETTDSRRYEADHVIVTLSLGVLKAQHETLFTPQLLPSKVNAINGLEFGVVGKIILFYDQEWWPSSWSNAAFLWDENVRREYENDPVKKWLLDFTYVTKLPYKPGVLVGWVNGPGCKHMETLPLNQLVDQTLDSLNRFLGKEFTIPRPNKILRTQWYTNKHFRGAYSYRSLESERLNVSAEDFASPIIVNDSPVVLFAGEATNSNRFATVDGAIETGIREANRLINIYKNIPN